MTALLTYMNIHEGKALESCEGTSKIYWPSRD